MPAERRKKGTGSIANKPRADGLWPGSVTLPNGKPKRLYGRTRAELEQKVADELRKIAEGRPAPRRDATLTSFLTDWVKRRRRTKRGLAPSTVAAYEQYIRLHIDPYLGSRRVSTITPRDLERLYDDLREKGLSESTIHRVHSFLHVALKDAERRGEVLRNPCDLIDPPADSPRPRRSLAVDDVVKYLKAASGDPDEALYVLAAETGLRQSELFALRRSDLDLDDATMAVPEKVRRVTGKGMVRSAPKTDAGDRTMALGGWAVAALRAHLARQDAAGRPNPLDLVFPSRAGTHVEPQNWYRRTWRPFLKRAGIDEATHFRALTRKVHASVAVAENVDPATLRGRMGHTDAKTTLDHYALAITDADRKAAQKIDRALRRLAQRRA
jgi:integrase